MSPSTTRVVVASHTFSNDETLRKALSAHFPEASFNPTGRILAGAELAHRLLGSTAAAPTD